MLAFGKALQLKAMHRAIKPVRADDPKQPVRVALRLSPTLVLPTQPAHVRQHTGRIRALFAPGGSAIRVRGTPSNLSLSLIAMIDASCYTTVDLHHTLAKQIAQAGAAYVTGRDSFDSYCTESLHLCPGSGANKVVGWAQDKLGPEPKQRAFKRALSKAYKQFEKYYPQ